MAYIEEKLSISDTSDASGNTVITLPPTVLNDLLLIMVTSGVGTTAHGLTGWTLLTGSQGTNDGQRSTAWWKIAGASEADPTMTMGANEQYGAFVIVVKGYNSANPINGVAKNTWTATTAPPSPSLTTTANNCLMLYFYGSDTTSTNVPRIYLDDNQLHPIGVLGTTSANGYTNAAGYRYLFTAGTATSINAVMDINNEGGTNHIIAIEDNGTGAFGIDYSAVHTVVERYSYNNNVLGTWSAPNSVGTLTSILGISMSSVAPTISYVNLPSEKYSSYTTLTNTESTAGAWAGGIHTFSTGTQNLNEKIVSFFTSTGGSSAPVGIQGRVVVFIDTSGKWAAYRVTDRIGQSIYGGIKTPFITLGVTTPLEVGSGGAPNFTAINRFGYFNHRVGSITTAASHSIGTLLVHDTLLVGGSSTRPIFPPRDLFDKSIVWGHRVISVQGVGQLLYKTPIQIGNGTRTTYLDMSGSSMELPQSYLPAAGRLEWNAGQQFSDITIYASSACTIIFATCLLATSTKQDFTIHPSSSTNATYNFAGMVMQGYNVTWKTGVNCTNATFSKCYIVDGKAATFNFCTFIQSVSTTSCIKVNNNSNLLNCNFTKSTETYAIEIQDAGTYNFSNTTFNGYTNELNITATTGAVTITLAYGQTVPNYVTAGATITFVYPNITASITNIVPGSRIQVYNETTSTEIANEIVSGTFWNLSFLEGVEFSEGDVARVRLTRQNGTTAYQQWTANAICGASGWSILASQQILVDYPTIGIDGSTVTEYSLDIINIEADANDVDGISQKKRLVAWFYFAVTTEDGIRNFFRAIVLEDAANAIINSSINNLKIDNISSLQLLLDDTDFRLYTDDGSSWILYPSTGGYGITTDTGKIYIANNNDIAAIKKNTDLIPATL